MSNLPHIESLIDKYFIKNNIYDLIRFYGNRNNKKLHFLYLTNQVGDSLTNSATRTIAIDMLRL